MQESWQLYPRRGYIISSLFDSCLCKAFTVSNITSWNCFLIAIEWKNLSNTFFHYPEKGIATDISFLFNPLVIMCIFPTVRLLLMNVQLLAKLISFPNVSCFQLNLNYMLSSLFFSPQCSDLRGRAENGRRGT